MRGLRRFKNAAGACGHPSSAPSLFWPALLAFAVATLILLAPDLAVANSGRLSLADPGKVLRVNLTISKSQTLRMDRQFAEVLVANPDFADAVPLTDRSIYIIGKRIGTTRLTVLDKDKQLLGLIELEVSYDVRALRDELRRSIPGGLFDLGTANGRILLGGSVPDAIALAKAVSITEQITSGCEANQIREIADAVGSRGASASQHPPAQAPAQETSLSVRPGAAQARCFVNSLTVRAPQQVLLEVRFVEAQRTASRDLGFTWDIRSGRFRAVIGATPAGSVAAGPAVAQGFPSNNVPFGSFLARILDAGTTADVLIQALEKRGLARRLAEPNLVALSGDTANFLAGGEFPFPVAQSSASGGNVITLEFKKFGVGLAFTPTVLGDGQINLKIEPEVSDIDHTNSFSLGSGITVPGLVVRRASTTVELRDGQSFAIAGLLQSTHKKDQTQLPWIGQVPVLGALFRSASYEKEESDLVIIVTPRLVRPAVPGQKLLTPLDQRVASNDRDFFVRGQQELPKQYVAPYGHILEFSSSWSPRVSKEAGHDASYK